MNASMMTIENCAQVQAGFSVKSALAHEPDGTHQVIMSKHLTPGEPYRYEDEHALRITPARSVDNYRLVPGDILFMSRGVGNYAVLLEDIPDNSIASLTFFIIKAKPNIDPGYLVWCLNQQPFQAQLNATRTGAGTPMIPRAIFNELRIPLPPLEEQCRIARLGNLLGQEQRLLRQLQKTTQLRQKLIGSQLLRDLRRS